MVREEDLVGGAARSLGGRGCPRRNPGDGLSLGWRNRSQLGPESLPDLAESPKGPWGPARSDLVHIAPRPQSSL